MSPTPPRFEYDESVKSDVSDEFINVYLQRPLAGLVTRAVYRFPVTPNHLTFAAIFFGIGGSLALSLGEPHFTAAALLFYLKDLLDSADGQLARAKKLFSRRGRFLDSIGDFAVSCCLFFGLFTVMMRENYTPALSFFAAFFGFWGMTLRVSYHVFYQTSFLHTRRKYEINRITEEILPQDFHEDGTTVRLQKIFLFLYGWQDRMMLRLDAWSRGNCGALSRDELTQWYRDVIGLRLGGLLGFGTEFVVLTLCLLLQRPGIYFIFTLGIFNCLWAAAIGYRRILLSDRIIEGRTMNR